VSGVSRMLSRSRSTDELFQDGVKNVTATAGGFPV